jgi:hypothetical protein
MNTRSSRPRARGLLIAFVAGALLVALLASIAFVAASLVSLPQPLELKAQEQPSPPQLDEDEDPAAGEPSPLEYFRDVTASSGVQFRTRNGEDADQLTLLESLGCGVALIDFDGDGLLDIFLVGGGYFGGEDSRQILSHPCKLFRNLGGWKFEDVTVEAGLGRIDFYSHGCAVADYDRDGWPDLLVTGYGRLALFHNEPDGHGGRRFVEVTEAARLHDPRWNTSAAWADLDGDGYPDLYVCHYVDWSWTTHQVCRGDHGSVAADVCAPKSFRGVAHALYRNNRDGTFTDVSEEAGLRQGTSEAGMGLGVVIVDVDGDGRPDVYAVNDTTRNFLYLNRSRPGQFRLQEVGLESGTAMGDRGQPDGSMGVDAADYDGSGRPSLWATTFENERHALYHNECEGERVWFRYATRKARIWALGSRYVGFGTAFVDVDNDGWEDIVIANGHVRRHATRSPLRQRALLLRNDGTAQFANITPQGGAYFRASHRGRGLAVGDLDNDGRPDLVISHLNAAAVVLRNDPRGDGVPHHHWLGLELTGRASRDVAGARVVVEVGGRHLTRFAKGGGSYLSASDRRILVGLGGMDRVGRVTVKWPWGDEQQWEGLTADRYWRLAEGERDARAP